jgi:CO dehydrogenase maturation factor
MLIDELIRHQFAGKILAIDADPAMTLSMALDVISPAWTLADVRDSTPLNARQIKSLPPGTSPSSFIRDKLINHGVIAQRQLRGIPFDLLVMGHSEGPGCYCRVNQALTQALASIKAMYDLVIIDNEAGMECVSRYQLRQIDLFFIVLTPGRSSWLVADRIKQVADLLELEIGQTWLIYNRTKNQYISKDHQKTIFLPDCETIATLDRQGGPLLALADNHSLRKALAPIVERICQCV